jgi:hypothetical protein
MLSAREIQESDIALITHYWLSAKLSYLKGMGINVNKMLNKEQSLQCK